MTSIQPVFLPRLIAFFLMALSSLVFGTPADFLRVTEIMYNAPGGSAFEYIELQNTSTTDTIDLSNVSVTNAVEFSFPFGTMMGPQAIFIVAKQPGTAFNLEYGISGAGVFGPYSSNLSNAGERLRVFDGGAEVVDFTYNDGVTWPCGADGVGHSIVPIITANQRNGALNYGINWKASETFKGSPGSAEPTPTPSVVINEVASNTSFINSSFPGFTANDWVELFNPTGFTIQLDDYYLSDDITTLDKWLIPAGTLAGTSFVTFDEVTGFNNPMATGFALARTGETLFLSHLPASGAQRIVDCVVIPAMAEDETYGRLPDGDPFYTVLPPTRDSANGGQLSEPIISEFMYHPLDMMIGTNTFDNTAEEFIELSNPNSVPVLLSNSEGPYEIKGTVDFKFPIGTTLDPGQHLLVVPFDPSVAADRAAFEAAYGISTTPMFGPYSNVLSNADGRITLTKPIAAASAGDAPVDVLVDEVRYIDGAPWDTGADGTGDSLTRVADFDPSSDPSNWNATTPSPGQSSANATNSPPNIALIQTQNASTGNLLQFTVSATDPNASQTITYSLLNNPGGATIDPVTGLFNWTPAGIGTFTVTVVASDDGTPSASAQQDVTITVIGANTPPTLNVPASVVGSPGVPLTFTAGASDPDGGQTLIFAAFGGPIGSMIDATSGVFTWTPTAADLGTTQNVTVAVADSGNPSGSDLKQVQLIVAEPGSTLIITDMRSEIGPAGYTLEFPAIAGRTYQVETALNLTTPTWVPGQSVTATGTLGSLRIPLTSPIECIYFYRILALP